MNRKAMTIVEMLISAALVVIILATGAAVFHEAARAQKASSHVNSVMDRLSVSKDVLSNDLEALIKDAPFAVWFSENGDARMQFFSSAGFSGYANPLTEAEEIEGSSARVLYSIDKDNNKLIRQVNIIDQYQYDLGHSNQDPFPTINGPMLAPQSLFDSHKKGYDSISLLRWNSLFQNELNVLAYLGYLREFNSELFSPETSDSEWNSEFWPILLFDGVKSLQIQTGLGAEKDRLPDGSEPYITRWFPDSDPYTSHTGNDSDYDLIGSDEFGVYFNMAGFDLTGEGWFTPGDGELERIELSGNSAQAAPIEAGLKPIAVRFRFEFEKDLDDSGNVKTFSQTVYLD
ncbi:hypothetical protein L21SP3_01247 [Sedimentisphaera cyanobacteriorum]|uniref:Uncharacterized protein n=1 Tax=Sedimentisphaera cyanobacteriorum TaxID=1940790 RepID=A0A1Q2HPQ5_9BACT|nr:hypothetical protein [Sedimentisphaera cyanobacteriorum]AQQ09442.1 hypothetical protein L21SP3_01247 [Sedimentisphaera cyanobacteriorum]